MRKILGFLFAAVVWILGCFEFVQYFPEACKIGDWSRMTTATVLALAASSGWFVVGAIVLGGGELPGRKKLRRVELLSDTVAKKLKSAKTIRIFCSQSESYRGFIHDRVSSLQDGACIKVMMRNDSTQARLDDLKKVAARWHNDIAGRGVTVEIRAVKWSPLMFRGWLFENTAVIGWYQRTAVRTIGQGKMALFIEDEETVQGLTATFDAVFLEGTTL